jgi:hypothetical protein
VLLLLLPLLLLGRLDRLAESRPGKLPLCWEARPELEAATTVARLPQLPTAAAECRRVTARQMREPPVPLLLPLLLTCPIEEVDAV